MTKYKVYENGVEIRICKTGAELGRTLGTQTTNALHIANQFMTCARTEPYKGVYTVEIIDNAPMTEEERWSEARKDQIILRKYEEGDISLKEASETGYWLELLYRTKYIDEQTFKALSSKCTSLRVMLIASCKTAKENIRNIK